MEPKGLLIAVPAGAASLYGELNVPPGFESTVVLIARALGVAECRDAESELVNELSQAGHSTLVVDLVEPGEVSKIADIRSDPRLLPNRLIAVCWWLLREQSLYDPVMALVGMPSAVDAALETASSISDVVVKALAILGGIPNTPRELLAKIESPTLLVAGQDDPVSLAKHHETLALLDVEKRLEEVPNVGESLCDGMEWTHVTQHVGRWLSRYLKLEARGEHTSHVLRTEAEPREPGI